MKYSVSIRYPRKTAEEFDFEHWAEVHMPLGIATLSENSGSIPVQVMVLHDTFGMDGRAEGSESYINVLLVFDSKKGLQGFMKLHNDRNASADLSDDFSNYAPLPPSISLGSLSYFDDMDAIVEKGRRVLDSLDS